MNLGSRGYHIDPGLEASERVVLPAPTEFIFSPEIYNSCFASLFALALERIVGENMTKN